jgi:hypothetical protein
MPGEIYHGPCGRNAERPGLELILLESLEV